MSDTLADLMLRNLSDVFGERDAKRRMAAIKDLYSEDAAFFEGEQRFEGHQAVSDAVAALHATFPAEFQFSAIAPLSLSRFVPDLQPQLHALGPEKLNDSGKPKADQS